ncbi:anticodon-binding protein [Melampsora americana]|nr:anticodon-binding protein [Melampsora americana]
MVVIGNASQIANKVQRSKVLQRLRHDKLQAKLSERVARKKAEAADPSLKVKRLKENIPRTIENTREWLGDQREDERLMPVKVEMGDENQEGYDEIKLDMGRLADLFEPYNNQNASEPPPEAGAEDPTAEQDLENNIEDESASTPQDNRVLITTSPRPSLFTRAFIHELANLFGGKHRADVIPRKTKRFELSRVCKWAIERGYSSMVVIGEAHGGRNRSGPTHMTVCRLPYGPTAYFRLTSIVPSKAIPGHAKPTSHSPELVLSNFSTPLGLSIGTLLQSVFPALPQLEGRQVVSVQNQRDFIFFRRFRYMFAEREKMFLKEGEEKIRARLQEIGPRFTLKIRWLKRGTLAGTLNQNVLPGEEGQEKKLGELERQREASRAGRRRAKSNASKPLAVEAGPSSEKDSASKEPIATSSSQNASDLNSQTPTTESTINATKKPKRKRKPKNSSGVEEKFLRGDRSDSEDPETSELPRKHGGLSSYMKQVQNRTTLGRNSNREVEFEWKPNMGVSRRKFIL